MGTDFRGVGASLDIDPAESALGYHHRNASASAGDVEIKRGAINAVDHWAIVLVSDKSDLVSVLFGEDVGTKPEEPSGDSHRVLIGCVSEGLDVVGVGGIAPVREGGPLGVRLLNYNNPRFHWRGFESFFELCERIHVQIIG